MSNKEKYKILKKKYNIDKEELECISHDNKEDYDNKEEYNNKEVYDNLDPEINYNDDILEKDYTKEEIDEYSNNNNIFEITTDGIEEKDYILLNENNRNKLKFCIICNKYFNKDMTIIIDDNTNDNQCYHCLFWLNYPISERKYVDGIYGLKIVEYIKKCCDFHDINNCTKNILNGGCFLCEYLLDIPITDIIDGHLLNKNNKIDKYQYVVNI
jgi:hypothetical protein